MDSEANKKIGFYAVGNSFVIVLASLFVFYFLYEINHLAIILIIFIFGFICNSLFFIYLIKDLKDKVDNLFEVGKYYLLSVHSMAIIYAIIAYFLFPLDYLFLFIMPMIGTVVALIIPFFYKKK